MYRNDPLVFHMKLKAGWASEFLRAVDVARERVSAITLPALIFHGTGDRLVPFSASEFIHKSIESIDKTFTVRPSTLVVMLVDVLCS